MKTNQMKKPQEVAKCATQTVDVDATTWKMKEQETK